MLNWSMAHGGHAGITFHRAIDTKVFPDSLVSLPLNFFFTALSPKGMLPLTTGTSDRAPLGNKVGFLTVRLGASALQSTSGLVCLAIRAP